MTKDANLSVSGEKPDKKKTSKSIDHDFKINDKAAIRELFLLAALWMPLGFFIWFKFGPIFVRLNAILSSWVLQWVMPAAISGISQVQHILEINTLIPDATLHQGRVALQVVTVNPMIYGYGIPLLLGLVMATPRLSILQRAAQLMGGYLVLVCVQTWGVFWEVLKDMSFALGPYATQAVAETGIPNTLIALCYQLGYLMLTPIAPLVVWIVFNRNFLEHITTGRERKVKPKQNLQAPVSSKVE